MSRTVSIDEMADAINEGLKEYAIQTRHGGTCLKGDFLAIDLDFLCNCHNRNPP